MIYIVVVGLLLAAHYLYDNFAPEAAIAADYTEQVEQTSDEPSAEVAPRKTTGAQWTELPAMKRQGDEIYTLSLHDALPISH